MKKARRTVFKHDFRGFNGGGITRRKWYPLG
jgi:hypothetical protein